MGGCRHRSVAVGGSRKRSAAAKRRTARRVYTLHGSATWLGCSPTTGRRAAIFSNGASKINHLWSKKGSSAPVLVCGGWFCRVSPTTRVIRRAWTHDLDPYARPRRDRTARTAWTDPPPRPTSVLSSLETTETRRSSLVSRATRADSMPDATDTERSADRCDASSDDPLSHAKLQPSLARVA
jgi:hypothetical protein